MDGVRIAYQVSGSGSALVLCHAMGSDHRMYDAHRDALAAAHTVITFDQRGSGDSEHPSFTEGPDSAYTIEAFGNDLKAVLDALGIERAGLVGYSMGAIAALSFATRWPQRVERLMLVSAMASRLPQAVIDRARLVEQMLDTKGIGETYDYYYSGELFDGLIARRDFKELVAQGRSKATYDGFKGCFRVTIDRQSLIAELGCISCPVLILVGENDIHYLAEAERLERAISNATRVVMPDVGHALAFQAPQAFAASVTAFFAV